MKVDGPVAFTRLCRDRLGVSIPVGGSRRGVWYKQLTDEMEVQGWSWEDLVETVDYIASQGLAIRTVFGVLFYVDDAIRARRAVAEPSDEDLHVKVAEALAVETDEYWRRRLSLAQGKVLAKVYQEWKKRMDDEVTN